RLGRFIHRCFILLLLAAYALAAAWPGPGTALRRLSLVQLTVGHETVSLTLPMLLLAGLLCSAGLGVDTAELARAVRAPLIVLTGLALNLLGPVVSLLVWEPFLRLWHAPAEAQNLILGLAVVAAMPVAGSSTAWTQHANGSVSLSLALVMLSTLLS